MAFKPVGVDENGNFPSRVVLQLQKMFAPIRPALSSVAVTSGTKILVTFDFTVPSVARPTVSDNTCVRWRGPSEPTNMQAGDEFVAVAA